MANDVSEVIKAYAAGFVDGEGYIGIRPSARSKNAKLSGGYALVVTIVNHMVEPLKLFQQYFGGYLYTRKVKSHWKPQFEFHVYSDKAYKMLLEILPYLLGKKEQAKVAIEWWEGKNHVNTGVKRPPAEVERTNFYYETIKRLNQRGK